MFVNYIMDSCFSDIPPKKKLKQSHLSFTRQMDDKIKIKGILRYLMLILSLNCKI